MDRVDKGEGLWLTRHRKRSYPKKSLAVRLPTRSTPQSQRQSSPQPDLTMVPILYKIRKHEQHPSSVLFVRPPHPQLHLPACLGSVRGWPPDLVKITGPSHLFSQVAVLRLQAAEPLPCCMSILIASLSFHLELVFHVPQPE